MKCNHENLKRICHPGETKTERTGPRPGQVRMFAQIEVLGVECTSCEQKHLFKNPFNEEKDERGNVFPTPKEQREEINAWRNGSV